MRRASLASLLVPLGLVSLIVGPAVVRGHIPWFMDVVAQFYPIRLTAARMIGEGVVPLWNPFYYGGVPLLANPQWATLFPSNWIFFAAPSGHTYTLTYLIAHLILMAGGWWLARALFTSPLAWSATALMLGLGGWTWAHYPFGAYLGAVCWAPWVMGCLERHARAPHRRWVLLAGLLWGLQLLAGAPQAAFHCAQAYAALSVLLAIRHRSLTPITLLIGSLLIALLLSAAQLLPTLDFLRHTVRGGKLPFETVEVGTLHLFGERSLLNALLGGNLFDPVQGEDAESTVYVGAFGLLLAVIGLFPRLPLTPLPPSLTGGEGGTSGNADGMRQPLTPLLPSREKGSGDEGAWPYAVLLLLAFLWSWTALAPVLHARVPGYGQFHDPKRALLVAHIALAVLVGGGVARLARWSPRNRVVSPLLAGVVSAAMVGGIIVRTTLLSRNTPHFPTRPRSSDILPVEMYETLVRWIMGDINTANPLVLVGLPSLFVISLFAIGVLFAWNRRTIGGTLALGLCLAIVTDLFLFAHFRIDTMTGEATEMTESAPQVASLYKTIRPETPLRTRVARGYHTPAYSYDYSRRAGFGGRGNFTSSLLPNLPGVHGLLDAQGFDPAIPARARVFFDTLNEGLVSLYPSQFCLVRNWASPLVDLLAIAWVVLPPDSSPRPMPRSIDGTYDILWQLSEFEGREALLDEAALTERYDQIPPQKEWFRAHRDPWLGTFVQIRTRSSALAANGTIPLRNTTAQPRLVHRARFVAVPNAGGARQALRLLGDRVREVAVLELPGARLGEHVTTSAESFLEIHFVDDAANHVRAEIEAPPGWVILRDQILPGWRAQIDGEAAPIVPADLMFRAVEWPGGRHTLEFAYRPVAFRVGWFLSLLALMAWFGAWLPSARRRSGVDLRPDRRESLGEVDHQ